MKRLAWLVVLLMLGSRCTTLPVSQIGQVVTAVKDAQLAISAYPRVLMSGQAVQLTWRIEPDPLNREFCVAVEGWRTFCQTAFDHRIYQQLLDGVPAGRYTVRLTVKRENGTTVQTTTDICVASAEFSCGETEPSGGSPESPGPSSGTTAY
jgi:hypothetical protein